MKNPNEQFYFETTNNGNTLLDVTTERDAYEEIKSDFDYEDQVIRLQEVFDITEEQAKARIDKEINDSIVMVYRKDLIQWIKDHDCLNKDLFFEIY